MRLMIALLLLSHTAFSLAEQAVNITPNLASVEVIHNGEPFLIQREQDPKHTLSGDFAYTSRECPPFCIQPAAVAQGVETIAELELLNYLERMHWGEPILVIDSRTEKWLAKGTIPGSVSIPWNLLNLEAGSNPITIREMMTQQFGVIQQDGLLDFSEAKTLVLFCNGPWCGQSPANIRTLLQLGYPAHKLKWYRGGLQAWYMLGFNTAPPAQ